MVCMLVTCQNGLLFFSRQFVVDVSFFTLAGNEQGLAMLGYLKIVRPEPLLIEKQMYKITTKSPPMLVLPEQLLPCC